MTHKQHSSSAQRVCDRERKREREREWCVSGSERKKSKESARPDVCSVLYIANGHAKQHRRKTQNGTAKNVQRKANAQRERNSRTTLSLSLSPAPSVPFCYLLCFVLLLRGPHLQGSAVADFYRFDCSLCSLRRDAADFAVAGRRQRAAGRSSCLMLYIFIVLTLFS